MFDRHLFRLAPLICSATLVACGGSSGGSDAEHSQPSASGFQLAGVADDGEPASAGMVAGEGTPTAPASDATVTGSPTVPLVIPEGEQAPVASAVGYPPAGDCSVQAQNQWVDASLRDYYLFYDQVPVTDLSRYSAPEQVLEDLRVVPPDRFSFMIDTRRAAQFSEGIEFGYGFRPGINAAGQLVVAQMLPASPAFEAGLQRGNVITAVNGVAPQQQSDQELFDIFLGGTIDDPRTSSFTIENATGEQRTVTLATTEFPTISAPFASWLTIADSGVRVGYLQLDQFAANATQNVGSAVEFLQQADIDELVVDLRYNPGGRILEALQNMTQLGGQSLNGQVAVTLEFNDKYAALQNIDLPFSASANSLELPRLIFLVTGETASAAELLINSLKPYREVVVIGTEPTNGKPFFFSGRPRCDRELFAVEGQNVNSVGESVVEGIAPNCLVDDDLRAERGDPAESMLQGALAFIAEGICITTPATLASNRQAADSGRSKDLFRKTDFPGLVLE